MKKAMLLFLALSAACHGWAQEELVMFSSNGGIYENSFQLSLECFYTNHHIRYTTNGNNPTAASTLYEAPLTLDANLYSHSDIYKIQISPDELVYIPDSVRHAKEDAAQHESGLGGNLIIGFLVFEIQPKSVTQDAQIADDADQVTPGARLFVSLIQKPVAEKGKQHQSGVN